MPAPANLLRVARALAPIREQRFVFAGASILPVLLDDPAAPPARPTVDVDAVVDVVTYAQWEKLRQRLRDCGVVVRADVPMGKARLCLFHLDQIDVDIMPVRMPALMRPSRMLELGYHSAEPHALEEGLEILTLSAPALLAAKLEAFGDRGRRALPASKDLEDIVALVDRRLGLAAEVAAAPAEMRFFIVESTRLLLTDGHVLDVISDLLRDHARATRLLEIMRRFQ